MSRRGLRARRLARLLLGAVALVSLAGAGAPALASSPRYARYDEPDVQRSRRAVSALQRADPALKGLFDGAAAYAVFAEMRAGGGTDGVGVLYEEGQAAGRATLQLPPPSQRLVGVPYVAVVVFKTQLALGAFKQRGLGAAAGANSVAARAGAGASPRWIDGVTVFTLGKVEDGAGSSHGSRAFEYLPYHREIVTSSR